MTHPKLFAIGLLLAALSLPAYPSAALTRVVYPAGEIENDTRFNDVIEILCLALEKTKAEYGAYECLPSARIMPKNRFLLELAKSKHEIDVLWNPTSEEMEQRFTPIRISLRKDLLGYRVALILKENQNKIDQVKTLKDLEKLTFGQGAGWIDNVIYQAHGIAVVQAQYGQLIKMLSVNRFDMFPRGVGEILSEYANNSNDYPNLAIEKNLLLYYPFPYYFFFNHEDKMLKERIETGLRLMQKDGSFDAIFNKYHLPAIEKLKLKERRIIRLENPLLPKDAPLDAPRTWPLPVK